MAAQKGRAATRIAFNSEFECQGAHGRVKESACMAHVRRPFYDLYEAHKSAVAKEALERAATQDIALPEWIPITRAEEDVSGRPAADELGKQCRHIQWRSTTR